VWALVPPAHLPWALFAYAVSPILPEIGACGALKPAGVLEENVNTTFPIISIISGIFDASGGSSSCGPYQPNGDTTVPIR